MRVAVLYNRDEGLRCGEPVDALAAHGVRAAAQAVHAACTELGWDAECVAAPAGPREFLQVLDATRADVVFNLVEGLGGKARLEAAAAWLLELAGVAYTGSPPLALALGLEKPLVCDVLRGCGLAVPEGGVLERGDEPLPSGLRYPCIVKPAREDASHGISTQSVVASETEARRRARWIAERYAQPALVQEFVSGREFNVSILGAAETAQALPLSEIDFTGFPPGLPQIVSYEAKWVASSPEYGGTASVAARDLDPDLAARIAALGLAAYRAVGLRDYGRIDLRLDPGRGPLVLEVNPNPDLSPDAGLARAAARADIPYVRLVARIVEAALERGRASSPSDLGR